MRSVSDPWTVDPAAVNPDPRTFEASASDPLPLVSLRIRPVWAYIDGVRELGRFICQKALDDSLVAERATLVLQETLENAVKYSAGGPMPDLEVSIAVDSSRLEISVTSRPDPDHVPLLIAEVARVSSLDPYEAYLAAFRRAAAAAADAPTRLGLARVRYEGNVELRVRDEGDGRFRVTAQGPLAGGP